MTTVDERVEDVAEARVVAAGAGVYGTDSVAGAGIRPAAANRVRGARRPDPRLT